MWNYHSPSPSSQKYGMILESPSLAYILWTIKIVLLLSLKHFFVSMPPFFPSLPLPQFMEAFPIYLTGNYYFLPPFLKILFPRHFQRENSETKIVTFQFKISVSCLNSLFTFVIKPNFDLLNCINKIHPLSLPHIHLRGQPSQRTHTVVFLALVPLYIPLIWTSLSAFSLG